ncbi:MAG TPA: right-handed parallel beta-helix repeat-containing protein, partial [Candidatus Deferrimicrobium sp.]|nr:right-handed parallel beta-helix repeat-containing protein [Candidatus Deferrimicrobium sp.]
MTMIERELGKSNSRLAAWTMRGLSAALILFLSTKTFGAVIHVPADQPTVQAGINAATSGDTVVVAPGTYVENIDFGFKSLVVSSHFLFDQDPAYILSTTMDGSSPTHPDTASVVLIAGTQDSTTVLQGFTITHGTGTVWTDPHGAGIYREGGGILIEYSSPIIRYNRIIDNEAVQVRPGVSSAGGGGIRAGDGNPHILNNVISNNRGRYGGGIVLNFASGVIKNNVVAYNTGGEDYG